MRTPYFPVRKIMHVYFGANFHKNYTPIHHYLYQYVAIIVIDNRGHNQ